MDLKTLLEQYKAGKLSVDETLQALSSSGMDELGFAKIDLSREERTGIPEVIYAAGKTAEQVEKIALRMKDQKKDVLATRLTEDVYNQIKSKLPGAVYNPLSKTMVYQTEKKIINQGTICIVTAGTSDIPVAEEAAVTAGFLGNNVFTIYDVGVAGIHRLFHRIKAIREARVIIVVAGMEGALASVVGGLVDKPVIAVPTSIGYGANFGGLSALLSMLNSCASGVSVVNIDNGFGAACQAHLINKL
ncbi:MAG: nickel pincer cofactor biosynthesis protein LarB [Bacteroidales bacterium]|nr:nickel pincer cofactor biosynthesis protein LarB [Bacteroidales bacterium]MCB9013819.1 nickel pincer cofactor biosynthesis protein LarB [Bacteroidales bacterium]